MGFRKDKQSFAEDKQKLFSFDNENDDEYFDRFEYTELPRYVVDFMSSPKKWTDTTLLYFAIRQEERERILAIVEEELTHIPSGEWGNGARYAYKKLKTRIQNEE